MRKRHEAVVAAPDILIHGEIHGALVAAHLDGSFLRLFEGVIAGILLLAFLLAASCWHGAELRRVSSAP